MTPGFHRFSQLLWKRGSFPCMVHPGRCHLTLRCTDRHDLNGYSTDPLMLPSVHELFSLPASPNSDLVHLRSESSPSDFHGCYHPRRRSQHSHLLSYFPSLHPIPLLLPKNQSRKSSQNIQNLKLSHFALFLHSVALSAYRFVTFTHPHIA